METRDGGTHDSPAQSNALLQFAKNHAIFSSISRGANKEKQYYQYLSD